MTGKRIVGPETAYTDRAGMLAALVAVMTRIADRLEVTTCAVDGCLVLLDEVCPACSKRVTHAA